MAPEGLVCLRPRTVLTFSRLGPTKPSKKRLAANADRQAEPGIITLTEYSSAPMSQSSLDTDVPTGVHFQAKLPVAWEPLPPDAAGQVSGNLANEELLGSLLVLDEAIADPEEDAQQEHWRRVEAKLDLMLSLLGEMLAGQQGLPAARPMCLGGEVLCIDGISDQPLPAAGDWLRLQLYLMPSIPRPLVVAAEVLSTETPNRLLLRLTGLSETTQDLLERFVFRQHRRTIAQARSHSSEKRPAKPLDE